MVCIFAAAGIKLQCGEKYGFEDMHREDPRAAQLYNLRKAKFSNRGNRDNYIVSTQIYLSVYWSLCMLVCCVCILFVCLISNQSVEKSHVIRVNLQQT